MKFNEKSIELLEWLKLPFEDVNLFEVEQVGHLKVFFLFLDLLHAYNQAFKHFNAIVDIFETLYLLSNARHANSPADFLDGFFNLSQVCLELLFALDKLIGERLPLFLECLSLLLDLIWQTLVNRVNVDKRLLVFITGLLELGLWQHLEEHQPLDQVRVPLSNYLLLAVFDVFEVLVVLD